jgi:hypothetical protein
VNRAASSYEGVLRQLAGVLVIADEAMTKSIHLTLMSLHQAIERLPVARHAGAHQLFVCGGLRIDVQHATRQG